MTWDDDLTGPAYRIAVTDSSLLRVIAGPGTGKTFALMRRVTRLLEQSTPPSRILVCTFTRTAAADLRRGVMGLGIEDADQVRAGTLHALCFGILSRSEALEATGRTPRPLLQFEERFLLEDIGREGFGDIWERRKRLNAFNASWARLQPDEPGWPHNPADRSFHTSLLGWLRFHNSMLIGELVPETLRFLRDNPAAPARRAFDHVLVDEYQDLNRAEQTLLDLLAEYGALAVIGDEDQSIYSFKYAHPEGISTFHNGHPGTHDESLETCRRCPRLIVELANHLIQHNQSRQARALVPLNDNPDGEVHVVQWDTMRAEAEGIAAFIVSRLSNGEVEAGSALVLTPRRQFGYAIRDALQGMGIPAHSFFHEQTLDGDPKRIAESRAQQALCLLTLLANPDDRVALRCWCGFGSSSLRRNGWYRIREHCESSGESPRVALARIGAGSLRIPYTSGIARRYAELQQRLTQVSVLTGQDLIDGLFLDGENWAQPFRDLADDFDEEELDVAELFEHLRTGITQPELPTDVDYVRIMSLHKSKGLTADLVVVAGCLEGLIPFFDRNQSPEQQARTLEEQRRLFYVAITRARRILVLSSVTRIPTALAHKMQIRVSSARGTHSRTVASRFLSELGPSRPAAVTGVELVRDLGVET